MEALEKRNWGLGLLLSLLLAGGMLVNAYQSFEDAQGECFNCFDGQYDFLKNAVLPTVLLWLGGLLGGLIIHHYVTPAVLRQRFGVAAILASIIALIFVFGAAAAYGYFNIELYQNDGEDGPNANSYFSALHLVQDTLKLLLVIFAYELVSETYYFLMESSRRNRSVVLKALAEFVLGFCGLVAIWYTIKLGRMVISGVPDCRECDWVTNFFWYWIIPVLWLHLHWFYRCIPIVRAGFTPQNQLNFLELLVVPFLVLVYFNFEISSNSSFEVTIFNLIAVHVIGVGSAYLRSIFAAEQRSFLTEVTQSSAELGALRAQINPHFLFNALNTLYAIAMKENSEKTADGIQKLGDMMRFMLHENHQNRIPLAKEIEYLHNLISIQELRLDENQQIELKINLQNPDRDVFIAPMLLNPFVENAFKHGISFRNPSWIYITLTHDPEHIFFKVHNSYHPKAENELDPEKDSHGIGLDNVRKRLDLLYPDKHELSIQVSEHDYFVSLILTIV